MVELTDTASDMADIIRVFKGTRADSQPAWQVFQTATGIPPSEFWNFCSVMVSRLDALRRLVDQIQDHDFKPSQKRDAHQAISRFSQAFLPNHIGTNWQNHVGNHIREEDATAFEWLSIIARRHQPLRKLTEEERTSLLERIGEVVKNLDADEELPRWAKQPLTDGLSRLGFVLQHLRFFGCDTAIGALVAVHRDAQALEAAVTREQPAERPERERSRRLLEVLSIIALAASLFAALDADVTAFQHYRGWALSYIAPQLPKPNPQRLLAPPQPSGPPKGVEEPSASAIEPNEPGQAEEPR